MSKTNAELKAKIKQQEELLSAKHRQIDKQVDMLNAKDKEISKLKNSSKADRPAAVEPKSTDFKIVVSGTFTGELNDVSMKIVTIVLDGIKNHAAADALSFAAVLQSAKARTI